VSAKKAPAFFKQEDGPVALHKDHLDAVAATERESVTLRGLATAIGFTRAWF
jgi:hypothetical protein